MVVSLLAGTTIETLRQYFPAVKIVRMMPNLPLVYGEGVIGLSLIKKIENEDKKHLTEIFESLGKIYWLSEEKIDALTALAGSGPAFFFAMVEAMIDAGIAMGFSASDAQSLIYQMLRGSLTLLEKTSKHPGELKWQIASPQGTTIAGLKRLEELALRGGIMNTFLAAYDRANKLSFREES
jgi:pyrroline-5-carboxylate reductase